MDRKTLEKAIALQRDIEKAHAFLESAKAVKKSKVQMDLYKGGVFWRKMDEDMAGKVIDLLTAAEEKKLEKLRKEMEKL